MSVVVSRNSSIPCEKESLFSTVENNQTNVLIKIFEGERQLTEHNHLLGTFELIGIQRVMKGIPKIHVKFKVDVNGILDIHAYDENSNTSEKITISRKDKLNEDEIKRMIDDSKKYEAIDKIKKETIECKNSFEKYLYSRKDIINNPDNFTILSSDDKNDANELIQKTLNWLNDGGIDYNDICNCKLSVDYYLKPIINKIYERQINFNKKMNDKANSISIKKYKIKLKNIKLNIKYKIKLKIFNKKILN